MSNQDRARGSRNRRTGFTLELWWEDRNLAQKILAGIGFGVLGIGLLAIFGWVVMALWNWLMPEIFGLKRLDYWQAWGLLILCTILFKGFGANSGRRGDRQRRRHLRQYLQEGQSRTAEDPAGPQQN